MATQGVRPRPVHYADPFKRQVKGPEPQSWADINKEFFRNRGRQGGRSVDRFDAQEEEEEEEWESQEESDEEEESDSQQGSDAMMGGC